MVEIVKDFRFSIADSRFNVGYYLGLAVFLYAEMQIEVRVNKSSAESAEQHSPGRKPWDQAWSGNQP